MHNTHVLVDMSFMGYLTFHGMRGKGDDCPAIIAESMMDRIRSIVQHFDSQRVLFCFDGKPPLHRKTMFKGYKAHREAARQQKDPEMLEKLDAFRRILWGMPKRLGQHGFAVADCPGYEADDMLAAAVNQLIQSPNPDVVIVTSDEDLFQCLHPGVLLHSPTAKQSVRDGKWLLEEYGVTPQLWTRVKAIAGCTSDGIPGVPGVGEKTACKYLTGTLKATTKSYASIEQELDACKARMPLVRLPWPHATLPGDWMDDARKWTMTKFRAISAELLAESEAQGSTDDTHDGGGSPEAIREGEEIPQMQEG